MTDGTTDSTPAGEDATPGHRAGGGALKGLIGMGVFLVAVLAIGAVLGFGPLAAPTPPAQVTDPREMIARGLQAVLDSTSVHVDGTVTGTIPGALVGQGDEPVVLDGMSVAADALPRTRRRRPTSRSRRWTSPSTRPACGTCSGIAAGRTSRGCGPRWAASRPTPAWTSTR